MLESWIAHMKKAIVSGRNFKLMITLRLNHYFLFCYHHHYIYWSEYGKHRKIYTLVFIKKSHVDLTFPSKTICLLICAVTSKLQGIYADQSACLKIRNEIPIYNKEKVVTFYVCTFIFLTCKHVLLPILWAGKVLYAYLNKNKESTLCFSST